MIRPIHGSTAAVLPELSQCLLELVTTPVIDCFYGSCVVWWYTGSREGTVMSVQVIVKPPVQQHDNAATFVSVASLDDHILFQRLNPVNPGYVPNEHAHVRVGHG